MPADAPARLRAWLEAHKRTPAWLSRELGVTRGMVAHWLHGRHIPSLRAAADIQRLTDGEVRAVEWVEKSTG